MTILLQLALACCLGAGLAAAGPAPAPRFLCADEGGKRIAEYGADGSLVWEHPAAMARDVWQLPNSNVLFCYNNDYNSARHDNPSGVMEVSRDHRVVFHFATTGQVWSCQRLENGLTLVGAASQGKLLLVAPDGAIQSQIRLKNTPGHSCIRNARALPNGRFLVAEESARAVREYTPEGVLAREIKVPFAPYSAVRLDNGDTAVCGQQTIRVVAPNDTVLWQVNGSDFPQAGIRWFAGLQALPDGSFFVANAGGKIPFLQIAPDKHPAWLSPPILPSPLAHGIQRLGLPGRPVK